MNLECSMAVGFVSLFGFKIPCSCLAFLIVLFDPY